MSPDDFIVTIHAFERLEERFPDLIKGITDIEQAAMIHEEVMDALDHGRRSKIPPLELAPNGVERWNLRRPGSYAVWTADKCRGYVLQEDPKEGLLVLTVLKGRSREMSARKLTRL